MMTTFSAFVWKYQYLEKLLSGQHVSGSRLDPETS